MALTGGNVMTNHRNDTPGIAALDIAQVTGWACSDLRSGIVDLTHYEDHATKGMVFEGWLKNEIGHCSAWIIERPMGFGSNVYTVNGLVWTAHMTAKRLNIPRAEVTASTWRKAILGKGNANKAAAIKWCRDNGHNPADDNEAEALCILEWAVRAKRAS